ncbi:MAG: O-antigen ligase [Parcubacteria bacterium C7867-005]|nr:MAG: O-antigen ligase [Parcubacteria bacterium C7867-005]
MNKDTFKWIALGGLFLVPFVPFLVSSSLFFPFITTKAFAFRIIIEIVFASWLILVVMAPEYRPKRSAIVYALLAFFVIIGLANLLGESPAKSFWSNYERMEGFVTLLHLGAFFLVTTSIFKQENWHYWWNTSLVASFIMVLYCTSQLLGVAEINQGGVRVDGTFGNAAYLAVYMLFHIFMAIMFFVRQNSESYLRWIYGGLVFCQVFILYHTATRGSILGLIGGVLLVALLNVRNRESKGMKKFSFSILIGLFILVGSFYMARNTAFVRESEVLSRFASISLAQIETEGRSFVWPMAIKGIQEKPLFGWGQENFSDVFSKNYSPAMFRLEPWFDRAHNIFLDWGIAGGMLGLISYLSLYIVLLYSVWKKGTNLSFAESSVLTGLLAGYFFHNLFVFDHLISYILFFSFLGYVHSRTVGVKENKLNVKDIPIRAPYLIVLPVVIVLVITLYFVNIKPISANLNLIHGLQSVQADDSKKTDALGYFKNAYEGSRLGRPETVEWLATSGSNVFSSGIAAEAKTEYFNYTKKVLEEQTKKSENDARHMIIAGSFFSRAGFPDEALAYLKKAEKLIPSKQVVYLEQGTTLLSTKNYPEAMKLFKKAYDMAPKYNEAQIFYFLGALYTNDSALINTLLQTLNLPTIAGDDRIARVLLDTGRYALLQSFLSERVKLNPKASQGYVDLAGAYLRSGERAKALEVLNNLIKEIPEYKDKAEEYILGIQNGTLN